MSNEYKIWDKKFIIFVISFIIGGSLLVSYVLFVSNPNYDKEKNAYIAEPCDKLKQDINSGNYDKWAFDLQTISNLYEVNCK